MLMPTSWNCPSLEVRLAIPIDTPAAARGVAPQKHPLATHNTALRPYLHPLRSRAGVVVTDAEPSDHPHHLGLSVAFSDVNGTNFWGGSTYTAAGGPMLLPNHGTQMPKGWQCTQPAEGVEESGRVSWLAEDGRELAVEQRRIRYFRNTGAATWALSLSSVIVPAVDVQRLEVSSSAVKGRKGAGYGGIFWRFPESAGEALVLSEAGSGGGAAHGSGSRWLSISLVIDGAPVTVLLAQEAGQILPWFVRAEGYLGAGPAVAWAKPAVVDHRNPLKLALHAVIHDGPVSTAARALELLDQHPLINPGSPDRTP
ncbi:hypothetical protein QF038_003720 [Pseudarthrobacter sp. W1I19]|uniref:DUF6807 family protein n=1 Tax=Pseudarthrobacter sp. W1I19 TaxID=3042288 RepID=UPI0027891B93|nr:DUF6807 family protein [Pseudarthrobacter sp. W1I19]MDQ0925212.1 hypothetical protein [Pseudarthrobacter sp. W1I19]